MVDSRWIVLINHQFVQKIRVRYQQSLLSMSQQLLLHYFIHWELPSLAISATYVDQFTAKLKI